MSARRPGGLPLRRWPARAVQLVQALVGATFVLALAGTADAATDPQARQRRCLAWIAYAEAAGEGTVGMQAVMRVVTNRVADPRFPKDACAVALQAGQFQPVGERPSLKRALSAVQPVALEAPFGPLGGAAAARLAEADRLAAQHLAGVGADFTGGALWFLNPVAADPAKCEWFKTLRRTTAIGRHVFFADRQKGAKRGTTVQCGQPAGPPDTQLAALAGKPGLAPAPLVRRPGEVLIIVPNADGTLVQRVIRVPATISPALLARSPRLVARVAEIERRLAASPAPARTRAILSP